MRRGSVSLSPSLSRAREKEPFFFWDSRSGLLGPHSAVDGEARASDVGCVPFPFFQSLPHFFLVSFFIPPPPFFCVRPSPCVCLCVCACARLSVFVCLCFCMCISAHVFFSVCVSLSVSVPVCLLCVVYCVHVYSRLHFCERLSVGMTTRRSQTQRRS